MKEKTGHCVRTVLPYQPIMNDIPKMPRWQTTLLSGFIILNLATVGFMNLPSLLCQRVDKSVDGILGASLGYQARLATWRWQQYAYFSGLDNKWQMFGYQSRFNWWYDIRAVYSDGDREEQVLLPLPNQSARTIAEKFLYDFKERKFELNIYLNEPARECYSRYLARQYPEHNGLQIQSVRWHLAYQNILPPQEAVEKKQLHDPHCYVQLLNDFEIKSDKQDVPALETTASLRVSEIAANTNAEESR